MRSTHPIESASISVYAGLSVSATDVAAVLPGAVTHPPAKQFDLMADIREGRHIVVIVDGVFHQTPAVSPIEIMDAMRRGLLVYGCSSMGALRAAELFSCGMRGVGEIFEWVRSSPGFRDDFLAQVFAERGDRVVPLSVPYVDFFFNLRRLVESKQLGSKEFNVLERIFREFYYPERTRAALVAALRPRWSELIPIATRALCNMPSQKRLDALLTLKRVKADLIATARVNSRITRPPA